MVKAGLILSALESTIPPNPTLVGLLPSKRVDSLTVSVLPEKTAARTTTRTRTSARAPPPIIRACFFKEVPPVFFPVSGSVLFLGVNEIISAWFFWDDRGANVFSKWSGHFGPIKINKIIIIFRRSVASP